MFGLELLKYKQLLKEKESTVNYLETKNMIKEDLTNFKKFRSYIKI